MVSYRYQKHESAVKKEKKLIFETKKSVATKWFLFSHKKHTKVKEIGPVRYLEIQLDST